jgi:hypothetical protein
MVQEILKWWSDFKSFNSVYAIDNSAIKIAAMHHSNAFEREKKWNLMEILAY